MRTTFKALCEEAESISARLPNTGKITGTIGIKGMNGVYGVVEYTNDGKAYSGPIGNFGSAAHAAAVLRGISYGLGRCGL